jgi:hypothetical protein
MSIATEKPFADVQRQRHEASNGRTASHGRTARKVCPCCINEIFAAQLERDHAATCRRFDYLEQDLDHGTSGISEPYLVTALEMEGLDASQSTNKANAWEAVPQTLAENCVGQPTVRDLENGMMEMQYQLKPEGMIMPDPAIAAEEHRIKTHLYEIKRHRPRLKAVFPTEPPEGITKPLLKATLKCQGTRVPQSAVVRVNTESAFFDVARASGKPLEIDLGATCLVSAFSTMGRHPSTRLYPHTSRDMVQCEAKYFVEDADYLPNHQHGKKYTGPYWTVRMTEDCVARTGSRKYHAPSWVSRYELWWRADGGRQWNALGTFTGNNDEWSEVAHTFGTTRGGVPARYLRVVPLECEGGGAMRVGVYGERLQGGGHGPAMAMSRANPETRKLGGALMRSTDQDADLVQYTLRMSRAGTGPRTHVRDGKLKGYKDKYYSEWMSHDRRAIKRCVARHTDEMLQEWRDRDWYDRQDAISQEEDAYMHGDDFSYDAATRHVVQTSALEAATEQEELDLALALSMLMAQPEKAQDEADVQWNGCGSDSSSVDALSTSAYDSEACSEEEGELVSEGEGWEMVEAEPGAPEGKPKEAIR